MILKGDYPLAVKLALELAVKPTVELRIRNKLKPNFNFGKCGSAALSKIKFWVLLDSRSLLWNWRLRNRYINFSNLTIRRDRL
jgi:hypothetical protein